MRVVDWDEAFARAANIAANSRYLAGTFSLDVAGVLDELRTTLPDLSGELLFDKLRMDLPDVFLPQDGEEVEPPPRLDEKKRITCPFCGKEFDLT